MPRFFGWPTSPNTPSAPPAPSISTDGFDFYEQFGVTDDINAATAKAARRARLAKLLGQAWQTKKEEHEARCAQLVRECEAVHSKAMERCRTFLAKEGERARGEDEESCLRSAAEVLYTDALAAAEAPSHNSTLAGAGSGTGDAPSSPEPGGEGSRGLAEMVSARRPIRLLGRFASGVIGSLAESMATPIPPDSANPPLTAARTVAADAAARRGRPLVTPEPRHPAATPGLRAALEEAEALGKPRAPAEAASGGAPAVEKALRFDDGAGYATRSRAAPRSEGGESGSAPCEEAWREAAEVEAWRSDGCDSPPASPGLSSEGHAAIKSWVEEYVAWTSRERGTDAPARLPFLLQRADLIDSYSLRATAAPRAGPSGTRRSRPQRGADADGDGESRAKRPRENPDRRCRPGHFY